MRVRVYRNLNKGGLSIQTKTEKGWRVTGYSLYVTLQNCTFKVREGGRQKVIRDGQKNVHAWVEGELIASDEKSFLSSQAPEPYYDPYTMDHFSVRGEPCDRIEELKIFSPPKSSPAHKASRKGGKKAPKTTTIVKTLLTSFVA
jgi:hypothetical protein